MKILTLSLVCLVMTACQQNHNSTRNIDPSFDSYVTRFEKLSVTYRNPVQANDLIMGYDSSLSGTSTLGYCRMGGGATPTVNMNPDYWARLSVSSKEQLIFHELGHCLLSRNHDERMQLAADAAASLPRSIMYPYHLGSSAYEVNHNYYLSELFGVTTYGAIYVYAPNQFDGTVYASTMPEETHYTTASKLVENANGELEIEGFGCGHP